MLSHFINLLLTFLLQKLTWLNEWITTGAALRYISHGFVPAAWKYQSLTVIRILGHTPNVGVANIRLHLNWFILRKTPFGRDWGTYQPVCSTVIAKKIRLKYYVWFRMKVSPRFVLCCTFTQVSSSIGLELWLRRISGWCLWLYKLPKLIDII